MSFFLSSILSPRIYYLLPFVALTVFFRKRIHLLYLLSKAKLNESFRKLLHNERINDYLGISYLRKHHHNEENGEYKNHEVVFFDEGEKYIIPIHRNDTLSVYDALDENEESISSSYIPHLRFLEKYKIRPLESFPDIKFLVKVI